MSALREKARAWKSIKNLARELKEPIKLPDGYRDTPIHSFKRRERELKRLKKEKTTRQKFFKQNVLRPIKKSKKIGAEKIKQQIRIENVRTKKKVRQQTRLKRALQRQIQSQIPQQAPIGGEVPAFLQPVRQQNNVIETRMQELRNFLARNTNPQQEVSFNLSGIPINALISEQLASANFGTLLQVGGQYINLGGGRYAGFSDLAREIAMGEVRQSGSDTDTILEYIDNPGQATLTLKPLNQRRQVAGGFFPHIHLLDKVNLSEYGVFRKNQIKKNTYDINCLERALKKAGIEESKLDIVRQMVKNRKVPQKDLKTIAEALKIHIKLNKMRVNGAPRIDHYNKNAPKLITLGLLEEHYFIIDKTKYTKYSIEHYHEIKDEKLFHNITRKNAQNKYARSKQLKTKMNSKDLIKLLLSLGPTHLKPMDLNDEILRTQYYDKKPTMNNLSINDRDCKPAMNYELKPVFEGKYKTLYFDFESTTNGDKHKPYLVCAIDRDNNKRGFIGANCATQFMNSLTEDTLLIAHNLRYDLQFLIDKLATIQNIIQTGKKVKTAKGIYYNPNTKKSINIVFKDSYALIAKPLRKFGKMFKLECKKEIMPYEAYTEQSIAKSFIKIEDAMEYLNEEEFEDFENNINEWGLKRGTNHFNHLLYSYNYCEMDCKVLKEGYETFRQWMMEAVNVDIDLVVSIPQLANKVGLDNKVFDGVYKLSGVVRAFIQQAVEGGRCMTRDNKKHWTTEKIQDFDAVSLYPSAMFRMDGFLKGKPKVITQDMINAGNVEKQDGYFVEIKITGLQSARHFPLLSIKNKQGIRNYTNDVVGKVFCVDKYKLEDLVKFQGITYEIIRGYYFNEGRNSQINGLMEKLFNERLMKKQQGNPIQEVYKLIMNAFYGKLIMKPIEKDIKFTYNKADYDKFYNYHYNKITKIVKISDRISLFELKKPIIQHFSMPQCGVEVLSYSKRIMNEVICLAEDLDIKIFYQDTDSMHIQDDKIQLLSDTYRAQYGRELIGKNMGQFHCDFDFKSDDLPVAVESIFLGKKTYIDKIEITSNGEKEYDFHIRCKGIPSSILLDKAAELGMNIFDFYGDLHQEKKYKVDLVKCCKFKSNDNFTTTNNKEFIRTLHFPNN